MPQEKIEEYLQGPFDLSLDKKRENQYFQMETKYIHFGLNGKRLGTESYLLKLQYIPKTLAAGSVDQYVCSELQLQTDDGSSVAIPDLKNWTYPFNTMLIGPGVLWGIPQEKFMRITDSSGRALPFSIRYAVYINFIDFHSINDIFSRPMKFGNGIQDIKRIGQRIVHPTSFLESPVNFGAEIKSGSIFQNGEVTLELKGLSIIDEAPCAIIAYDAGESNVKMILPVSIDQDSVAKGGSQYKGDIYVDLATRGVRKATLDEYMITETTTKSQPLKINEYTVRHILLRSVDQEEFKTEVHVRE
jgi:dUTPase